MGSNKCRESSPGKQRTPFKAGKDSTITNIKENRAKRKSKDKRVYGGKKSRARMGSMQNRVKLGSKKLGFVNRN
jgi:hypothetical protein